MPATRDLLRLYLGITARGGEQAALRLLLDLGREFVAADEASLLVLDRRRGRLLFALTCGSRASEEVLRGQSVPLGRGLTGLAAATGEPQIGAPTYRDVRQRRRRGGGSGDPEAVLAAPMLVGDRVVGVLTAASFRRGRRFARADALAYARIASVAGAMVEQQQRLASLERIARGARGRGARTPGERHLARIVDGLGRLAAGRPARLAGMAALVAALESLCAGGRA